MTTRPSSQIIRAGQAAMAQLGRGNPATARRLMAALDAMTLLAAQHGSAGKRDQQAGALAERARLVRMLAELPGRADPGAGHTAALRAATEAAALAMKAAEAGGVNDVNLSAYVVATDERGLCALELGRSSGKEQLTQAAGWLAEAEAGYRRLGRDGPADTAGLGALEAQSLAALAD